MWRRLAAWCVPNAALAHGQPCRPDGMTYTQLVQGDLSLGGGSWYDPDEMAKARRMGAELGRLLRRSK